MEANLERRRSDLDKLNELARRSSGRIRTLRTSGRPVSEITIELRFRTAGSRAYPAQVLDRFELTLTLPARYPWVEPLAVLAPPVFHPNIYSSGRICLGTRWIATEGLNLLVQRIVQIVIFDPSILNSRSPANREALLWYERALARHPSAFPTDHMELPPSTRVASLLWKDLSAPEPRRPTTVVKCGTCSQQLRVPADSGVQVRCTKCGRTFRVSL